MKCGFEDTIPTADETFASQQLFKILKAFDNSYFNELHAYQTLDFHDEYDEITDEEESTDDEHSSDEEEGIDDYDENQSSEIQNNFTLEAVLDTIDIINFISFGIEYKDKIFGQELNDITDSILISVRYAFFNQYYDKVHVSRHGLIILGNNSYLLSLKIPDQFSLEDLVYVTSYWIDTNNTNDSISKIFYRKILLKNERNALSKISETVHKGYSKLAVQRMLWTFIVTWHQLSNSKNSTNRNTYQAILNTNGFYLFTLFIYHKLQGSQGSSSIHSQIGFNTGDKMKYYKEKMYFSPLVLTIVNDSNIDIPDQLVSMFFAENKIVENSHRRLDVEIYGAFPRRVGDFVFHASDNFSDIQYVTSTGLQVSSFRGSIYGRYEFRLDGICFNKSVYEIHIHNQIFNDCHVLSTLYIVCLMPMLIDSGKIKIEVYDRKDKILIDSIEFLAHVPEDHGELILTLWLRFF
ncbi:unnamed protein product [Rotaria sp. Silwood2]|nr:unnamed protein product [Rotaria sp. Silwood2]